MPDNDFPEGTHHPVHEHRESRRHMAPSEEIRPHKVSRDSAKDPDDGENKQPASPPSSAG